ncbi:MAG: hypothetical protein VX265_15520, partial [Myxococcota bacterium]|nr:hypothetical protein [Myxococcota bacterium]
AVAFSFCQVPVVVQTGAGEAMVRVEEASGSVVEHRGAVLDARTTARLRARDASIRVVRVSLP